MQRADTDTEPWRVMHEHTSRFLPWDEARLRVPHQATRAAGIPQNMTSLNCAKMFMPVKAQNRPRRHPRCNSRDSVG